MFSEFQRGTAMLVEDREGGNKRSSFTFFSPTSDTDSVNIVFRKFWDFYHYSTCVRAWGAETMIFPGDMTHTHSPHS